MQLSDNQIQFHTSWEEIDAGKFYKFLPLEKALSACKIRSIASNWVELKEDKSTLRAVVNDKVIGVPDDFLYEAIFQRDENNLAPKSIIEKLELQVYIQDFGNKQGDYKSQ